MFTIEIKSALWSFDLLQSGPPLDPIKFKIFMV